MCLDSWERTQKGDPHKLFRGDFGVKGGPKWAIFGQKKFSLLFFPVLSFKPPRLPGLDKMTGVSNMSLLSTFGGCQNPTSYLLLSYCNVSELSHKLPGQTRHKKRPLVETPTVSPWAMPLNLGGDISPAQLKGAWAQSKHTVRQGVSESDTPPPKFRVKCHTLSLGVWAYRAFFGEKKKSENRCRNCRE